MIESPSIVMGNEPGYPDGDMPVVVSLLRAVNVDGRNMIRMDALRAICTSLNLRNPRTLLQSGNVVFRTEEEDLRAVASSLENAIEKELGFRPDVINRTAEEIAGVIGRNPFTGRDGWSGSKLLVTFLSGDPGEQARQQVREMTVSPEELFIGGREMYIYYPDGVGQSKLRTDLIGKAVKTPGTARNWNTVMKLHEMAKDAGA